MRRYFFIQVAILPGAAFLTAGLFRRWDTGDLQTNYFHAGLAFVMVATAALMMLSPVVVRYLTRKQELKRQEQTQRHNLEEEHLLPCSTQVLQAAEDLAYQEGMLGAYKERAAEITSVPPTIGEVWLALEHSRVSMGLKRAPDKNLLTQHGNRCIKA